MKKISNNYFLTFSIFYIIITFWSCDQQKVNILEKEALEALKHDTIIINQNNEIIFHFFKRNLDNAPDVNLELYNLANKTRNKSYEIRNQLNKVNKSVELIAIQDSVESFKKLLDQITIFLQKKALYYNDQNPNPDSLFTYKEIQLQNNKSFFEQKNTIVLTNNILIVENKALKSLYSMTPVIEGIYFRLRFFILDKEKLIRTGSEYSAFIVPNVVNEENVCELRIDYVIFEGKKIETRVKTNWERGIGKLNIYAPQKGNYFFSGKVFYKVAFGTISSPIQGFFSAG